MQACSTRYERPRTAAPTDSNNNLQHATNVQQRLHPQTPTTTLKTHLYLTPEILHCPRQASSSYKPVRTYTWPAHQVHHYPPSSSPSPTAVAITRGCIHCHYQQRLNILIIIVLVETSSPLTAWLLPDRDILQVRVVRLPVFHQEINTTRA